MIEWRNIMANLMKLYQQLYTLTEKEERLINEEKYEEIISLLKEKEELIQQIEGIDKEEYIKNSAEPRKTYNGLLKLLETIKVMEAKNISKLNSEVGQVKKQLKGIYKGLQSQQGYQGAASFKEAKFIDKRS